MKNADRMDSFGSLAPIPVLIPGLKNQQPSIAYMKVKLQDEDQMAGGEWFKLYLIPRRPVQLAGGKMVKSTAMSNALAELNSIQPEAVVGINVANLKARTNLSQQNASS